MKFLIFKNIMVHPISNIFIGISFLCFYTLVWHNNLFSLFSIIDDHIIIYLVGKDNIFTFKDIFKYLNFMGDFSINKDTFSGRFRPSFQLIRMFEIFLFDANVFLYQLLRFITFYSFLLIIIFLILKYNGYFYGFLIILTSLSFQFWSDIFTRIITSEFYVIFGLTFFIPTCYKIKKYIEGNHNNKLKIFLFSLLYLSSGLIVIGSKENFIFLIIIPIYFLYLSYKKSKFDLSVIFSNIILILFSLLTVFILLNHFIFSESDISGFGSFEYILFIKIFYKFTKILLFKWGFFYTLIILFFTLIYPKSRKTILSSKFKIKKIIRSYFPFLTLLMILLIFQLIFYTGQLPTGNRYDFPSLFFFILFCTWQIKFLKSYLEIFNWNAKIINNIILSYLILLLFFTNPIHIYKHYQNSSKHFERTLQFNNSINQIVSYAEKHPQKDIIINTFNVWDYELISSVNKYLKYNNLNNKTYLKVFFKKNDYQTSVEHEFVRRINKISYGLGDDGDLIMNKFRSTWKYESIENFIFNKNRCISINLKRHDQKLNCGYHLVLKYSGH